MACGVLIGFGMKRTTSPRLKLNRNTVRALQATDLAQAAGGFSGSKYTGGCSGSCSCDTQRDITCATNMNCGTQYCL